ncbi:MAG: hypothetical protein IJ512_05400 [Ruminococcus sp.]|nr:hypothetical protein [Ruminococcus sp.]
MLTPEYYESCSELILQQYAELEDAILRDIIRRIMKTGIVTESAKWQAEMLQEAGLVYNDIVKSIAEHTGMIADEVQKLFEEAGVETVEADNVVYRQMGKEPKSLLLSAPMMQVLEAGYRKTLGQLDNLTATMPSAGQRMYINACNQAYMKVTSGAFSYQQAVMQAVKETAASGLKVIEYDSGRSDRLEVAVLRAVRTGVGQTCREVGKMNAEENGCELMEISAHAGARPEHAAWQGQLVDLTGRRRGETIDGLRVLSLSDIGYGQITGFGGANCRHDWYPYFEGYSTPNYTQERLEQLNARNIEYNGKLHTQYEISQMQRAQERKIRELKRRTVVYDEALKNAPDAETKTAVQKKYTESAVKLKAAEQKLSDFCKATGQDRERFREQVNGFGRSQAQRAVWANRKMLTSDSGSGIIKSGRFVPFSGALDKSYQNALERKYNSGTVTARAVYDKYIPQGGAVADGNHSGAYHSPKTHEIYMSFYEDARNPRGAGTTWFHEHGHYVDCDTGYVSRADTFREAIFRDVTTYEKVVKKKNGFLTIAQARTAIGKELVALGDISHSVQDIFGGAIGRPYPGANWAHKKSYWKTRGSGGVSVEAFAHMFEASFSPEKKVIMKYYLPNAWAEFEKLLGGLV